MSQLKRGGLRIYHPTLRDAVLLVPSKKKRPQGTDKDLQVVVDSCGYALVSEGVWESLERARRHGQAHEFLIVNTVEAPPAMRVGDGPDFRRRTFRQEQTALREIAPAGVATRIVPHQPPNIRSN